MAVSRLRVGVLVDGFVVAAWQRRALEEIRESGYARIAVVVRDARSASRSVGARLFEAYRRADRRLFGIRPDAFEPTDCGDLLRDALQIEIGSSADGAELDRSSLEAIRGQALDVLLHLGGRRLQGAVLESTRLGVWTWWDLELERRGFAPYLAEFLAAHTPWESSLIALAAGEEPERVLLRSWSSFEASPWYGSAAVSLQRGHGPIAWKSASFAARCLRSAATGGPKPACIADATRALPPRRPRIASLLRLLASVLLRSFRRWRGRRTALQWFISVRREGGGFEALPCPPGEFAADPFLVAHGSRLYLFYEGGAIGGKGLLRCSELDQEGRPGESRTILEREDHLSYPFVFEWRGEWFMIPESSERRTIELYRAREFPWRWELERVLFQDLAAVDATLWEQGELLWMFVATSAPGGSLNEELSLFFAESPFGPWQPHPQNPVVSDVRCARPAGRLFVENGLLIRPAQDCAEHYGRGLRLQRVDALNETEYREAPLRSIGPDWLPGSVSTHTVNHAGGFEVTDGQRPVRRKVVSRAGAQ